MRLPPPTERSQISTPQVEMPVNVDPNVAFLQSLALESALAQSDRSDPAAIGRAVLESRRSVPSNPAIARELASTMLRACGIEDDTVDILTRDHDLNTALDAGVEPASSPAVTKLAETLIDSGEVEVGFDVSQARCFTSGADTDLFFIADTQDEAVQLCNDCPVREECLDYALDNDLVHGIWGGLTEGERRRLKARLRRDASVA